MKPKTLEEVIRAKTGPVKCLYKFGDNNGRERVIHALICDKLVVERKGDLSFVDIEDIDRYYELPKPEPRIASPALQIDHLGRFFTSSLLCTNEHDAKQTNNFISWPAKDGSGSPIEYQIPEGEE